MPQTTRLSSLSATKLAVLATQAYAQVEDVLPLASEVKLLALPKAYRPDEFPDLLARVLAQD